MPLQYTSIRDRCIAKGGSPKSCKTYAAKIYNGVIRKHKPSLPPLSNKHKSK